jgi:frataxin-like iron-binding protein CyaY
MTAMAVYGLTFLASFNNGRHFVANDDTWTGKYALEHLVNILPRSFIFQVFSFKTLLLT